MNVESAALARLAIITHYAQNARQLPWRVPPGSGKTPDPYPIWLSEVMLQQTTVAAVTPYFERFTARWSSVSALAAADPADVLAAWAGLGYYSRARNLIACACIIAAQYGGQFPCDTAVLRSLPGIGDYTAAAIAAIAFGASAIPIDANVTRVVARLFAIETPLPAAQVAIRDAAAMLWPELGGGDFAQALMDLGAGVCSSRAPLCTDCPASPWCMGRQQGIAHRLPVKPAKKPRPERYGRALWIEADRGGAALVWLVRRPAKGLLGGMRALPSETGPGETGPGEMGPNEMALGSEWGDAPTPPMQNGRDVGTIRHIFTHFALNLSIACSHDVAFAVGEGEWWPIKRLDEAGLPSLYRRAGALIMSDFEEKR